jgi:hypothetical protein
MTWTSDAGRTGIITSVVVDILEVTVVSAAARPQRPRATRPKATQVALRCRMLLLEVTMIINYLSARVECHESDNLEALESRPSPSVAQPPTTSRETLGWKNRLTYHLVLFSSEM